MDLVQQLVGSSSSYEYPLLMSTIQLMTCLAEQHVVASILPQEAIQSWMELSSWLIRSSQSSQMLGHVARLLRAVIKVKNVTLLIEVYRYLDEISLMNRGINELMIFKKMNYYQSL